MTCGGSRLHPPPAATHRKYSTTSLHATTRLHPHAALVLANTLCLCSSLYLPICTHPNTHTCKHARAHTQARSRAHTQTRVKSGEPCLSTSMRVHPTLPPNTPPPHTPQRVHSQQQRLPVRRRHAPAARARLQRLRLLAALPHEARHRVQQQPGLQLLCVPIHGARCADARLPAVALFEFLGRRARFHAPRRGRLGALAHRRSERRWQMRRVLPWT